MEQTISSILKKAADKSGFKRVRYQENKIPTSISNIVVFIFFGDIKSTFIFSSLLANRIREESHGSKYFILCSWNGCEGLFPNVDEYWDLRDESLISSLKSSVDSFSNKSQLIFSFKRGLNSFFENVLDVEEIYPYYQNGFKKEFFNRFKNIKKFLPSIPSSVVLGNEFNKVVSSKLDKILIYPVSKIQVWKDGKIERKHISKDFWINLTQRLLDEDIMPFIYQSEETYDLSPDFLNKCFYIKDKNVLNLMSAMRSVGLVLDILSGISRYAIAARCPYLVCEERQVFNYLKSYEIDELTARLIPKDYFYVFSSVFDELNKNHWNSGLINGLMVRIKNMLKNQNRDSWESPSEVYEVVPYSDVKERKLKKLGTKFIKVPKE